MIETATNQGNQSIDSLKSKINSARNYAIYFGTCATLSSVGAGISFASDTKSGLVVGICNAVVDATCVTTATINLRKYIKLKRQSR